jgi:hypothetical protein
MPGSPKKRAKREAAGRAKQTPSVADRPVTGPAVDQASDLLVPAPPITVSAVPVYQGVIDPPADAAEPTRTALKRAMRTRAQEHAEKAIAVLVVNLDSKDPRIATAAANDLLAWGFGKPSADIELSSGDQMIVIRRFGEPL